MSEVTLPVPNALLFVLDPNHQDVQVPEYASGALVAANATCASIATLADVDGEVTVRLIERDGATPTERFVVVFDGTLETPSRRVAIVTSQFESVLEQEVGRRHCSNPDQR